MFSTGITKILHEYLDGIRAAPSDGKTISIVRNMLAGSENTLLYV